MSPQQFWNDVIHPYSPPVLLPDIGTFFNRDMAQAAMLLRAVHASGVRYIKGEILHDADICLPGEVSERYLGTDAQPISENYRRLIERKTVALEDYRQLFAPCRELGLGLVLSVYDFRGADFAQEIGACALKIASTNIVHAPLIRHCAGLGLPLLLDTGKATRAEIRRAFGWARAAGTDRIVMEYSPPAPPAPVEHHNLRVLHELQQSFGGPIGLSDHHAGEEMLYAATALGCRVLEKGVCADTMDDDQDVFHALPIGQLAGVRRRCHAIHAALGNAQDAYPEIDRRPAARMGLIATRDLASGDRIESGNIGFAFPTIGIGVEDWDRVSGQQLHRAVSAGSPLSWQDVDA